MAVSKLWEYRCWVQIFIKQVLGSDLQKQVVGTDLNPKHAGILKSLKTPIPIVKMPSSDSEAATIYKLKGQPSNMQTGLGFKYRELVRPADPSS